jgi:Secretion system C-terminal sorting domain
MSTVKLLFTFLSFCFISISFPQPLNNSFENWTSGMLDNWFTDSPQAVSQSSVAYNGASSAKLEVIDLGGFAFIPIMSSLTSSFGGHPVSERHGSLQGWYQSMPLGNDVLIVSVIMLEGPSNSVGSGAITIPGTVSGWTQFNVPIFYVPGSPVPDNTIITIQMVDTSGSGESGTIGSMAYVDYLTFTGPSAVEQINGLPNDFSLTQNYPNPFNPTTNIEYSIPVQSYVELKVYDVLGNEVATLVNEEQSAGTYRVDFSGTGLSSGTYIAKLQTGNYIKTIKMALMK